MDGTWSKWFPSRKEYSTNIIHIQGLGNNITLGSHSLADWAIFPFGEMDGKKLTKYSQGLKDNSIIGFENTTTSFEKSVRNRGSGNFYVGNFSIPPEDPVEDTFVRLDGFSKVSYLRFTLWVLTLYFVKENIFQSCARMHCVSSVFRIEEFRSTLHLYWNFL